MIDKGKLANEVFQLGLAVISVGLLALAFSLICISLGIDPVLAGFVVVLGFPFLIICGMFCWAASYKAREKIMEFRIWLQNYREFREMMKAEIEEIEYLDDEDVILEEEE